MFYFLKTYKKLLLITIFLHFICVGFSQQNKINENGFNTFYYPTGQVSSEGYMTNGKPDGKWVAYYVTGVKKSEGIRVSNSLEGEWLFFNQSGDTIQKISYLQGKKNGYTYTYKYDASNALGNTGYLASKELYMNNQKQGNSFDYYPDGSVKSEFSYSDNNLEGETKEFNSKGVLQTIKSYRKGRLIDVYRFNRLNKNKQREGVWREYYSNGNIKEEKSYSNGILNGTYKEYTYSGSEKLIIEYDNGEFSYNHNTAPDSLDILIIDEYYDSGELKVRGSYKDSIPIGVHRMFSKEGSIIAGKIYGNQGNIISRGIIEMNGERRGKWIDYYETGEKYAEGAYVDGVKNGKWTYYSINGSVEQEGSFVNNVYSGIWKWYYSDGKLHRKEEYLYGLENGLYEEYSKDGKIIEKGNYLEGEKDGKWIHITGDVTEKGEYVSGLKQGNWITYYKNGEEFFNGEFIRGVPNGYHHLYYENGRRKEERYYKMGYREKLWKKYDTQGQIIISIYYKNNKESKVNGTQIK